MNSTQAKRALVLSMAGTGAVIVVARVSRGTAVEPRVFIALGFVYIVVSIMTDVSPNIAGPLSGLIFVGAILSVGTDAAGGIQRAIRRKPQKPKRKPPAKGAQKP